MNPAEFLNISRVEEEMWWFRGMRRITDALLDRHEQLRPSTLVLEAGCGTGYQSHYFQSTRQWKMLPADLSLLGLQNTASLGLQRALCCDVSALPLRSQSFDMVASLDVIVHFPRDEEGRALLEFHRVLRPNGRLLLRVSALDVLHSRHSQFVHEQQRFTASRLRSSLEAAGFRIQSITYANCFLFPVTLFLFRVWEPLTRQAPASGVKLPAPWLNTLLEWPLRLEAWLIRRGVRLPIGQSLLVYAVKP
jgi:SAM-dependent methyltransferase